MGGHNLRVRWHRPRWVMVVPSHHRYWRGRIDCRSDLEWHRWAIIAIIVLIFLLTCYWPQTFIQNKCVNFQLYLYFKAHLNYVTFDYWKFCYRSVANEFRDHKTWNINLSKYNSSPRPGIEPTTSRFYSYTLCPCATTGLLYLSWLNYDLNLTVCVNM